MSLSLWLGWMISIHGMNIKPYLTFATGILLTASALITTIAPTLTSRTPNLHGCTIMSEYGWICLLAGNQADFMVVWFLVNWTQMKQRILYNAFLPFLPGCEFGDKCFLKQRLRVLVQEYCGSANWLGERRCVGWACLSKHRGLQFAETLGDAGPFLLCAETTNRFVCQRQCCLSLSCKSWGVWLGSTCLRRHKPDLPSYPPPKRKGCLLSVIWLMCILGTYNNTHRVNPLSVTCCCLI